MALLSRGLCFALLLTTGCGYWWDQTDADGDGYSPADGDCWDDPNSKVPGDAGLAAADINPAVAETWYDGFDADCDGADDYDADGDGFVPDEYLGLKTENLAQAEDDLLPGGDCWDVPVGLPSEFRVAGDGDQLDARHVNPAQTDLWYDGIDADCDGADDFDQDGDGFRTSRYPDADGVYGDDCIDGSRLDYPNPAELDPSEVNVGATETWYDGTDSDCSGGSDYDADGDGYDLDEECDDGNADLFPNNAAEVWYDGIDSNCDGANDFDKDGDGFESAVDGSGDDCWDDPDVIQETLNGFSRLQADDVHPDAEDRFYDGIDANCDGSDDFDQDGDGYDAEAYMQRDGSFGDDCIDGSVLDAVNPGRLDPAAVNPGAVDEYYDGTDADCAGDNDYDADLDGFTLDTYGGTDCDDSDASINLEAVEDCDTEADDDCSGSTNDNGATNCLTFYADGDGDGYGDESGTSACLCMADDFYAAGAANDCDDGDAAISPEADEVCDGADNNCDGEVDENTAVDVTTWYRDQDDDGYGNETGTIDSCDEVDGYVDVGGDCDDTCDTCYTGADEVCDGDDNNCDGQTDEATATDASTWYADLDGDGYGDPDVSMVACDEASGWTDNADDCDDTCEVCWTDAAESCDGEDNDCNGSVDDGVLTTWYLDGDADGYGTADVTVEDCTSPSGYSADSGDCDDFDDAVHPLATEVCEDGIDNDCNGSAEECEIAGTLDLVNADAKLVGETSGDMAGDAVAGGGDLNGDGIGDLLIGAASEDTAGTNAGAVYVVFGDTSGWINLGSSDAILSGDGTGDSAGTAVASAGDVDGDGFDDILVGATGVDDGATNAGAAYLVTGPITADLGLGNADAILLGLVGSDSAGASLVGLGDLNGDGFDDVAVGAPGSDNGASNAGSVYLLSGPLSGTADLDNGYVIDGTLASGGIGGAVGGGADIDGDGTGDLVIGASSAGSAWVVLGPVTADMNVGDAEFVVSGLSSTDGFGVAVAAVVDLDGDGYGDVLVGAPGVDEPAVNAGAAFLFYGPVSGAATALAADAILSGESANDAAGSSVADLGDLDSDGFSDIGVGAPTEDTGGTNAGAAYIFYGPLGGSMSLGLSDAKANGESAGNEAGSSIATAGDHDGDGHSDVLIGAPGFDYAGSNVGAAYIWLGGSQ